MRWRYADNTEDRDRIVRFAWLVSFLATLSLVAILAMAKSAQAETVAVGALAATQPFDTEYGEEAGEEGEEIEFEECDEEEEEECEEEEADPEAPEACLLSSAHAAIFASSNRAKVRLQVRYDLDSPSAVAVEYGLHGSKGALFLGSDRKRFARHGVFHTTRKLTDSQMAKVLAAKNFTVRLNVLAAPPYCLPFFDRQLSIRRATPGGLTWLQSE